MQKELISPSFTLRILKVTTTSTFNTVVKADWSDLH